MVCARFYGRGRGVLGMWHARRRVANAPSFVGGVALHWEVSGSMSWGGVSTEGVLVRVTLLMGAVRSEVLYSCGVPEVGLAMPCLDWEANMPGRGVITAIHHIQTSDGWGLCLYIRILYNLLMSSIYTAVYIYLYITFTSGPRLKELTI